jgi:D-alanyl-D-alanine carboxypeptidase
MPGGPSASDPSLTASPDPAPRAQAPLPVTAPQANRFAAILGAAAAARPNQQATWQAAVFNSADNTLWMGASGPDAATPQRPIRMASVGKTFTAATIFRLMELGRLTLDDAIDQHLSVATVGVLRADGYLVEQITIRHLLGHNAGLFDYTFGVGSPVLDRVVSDPTHQWTRREQLQLAVDVGDPLFAPGRAFHYGDTSYVLLGEIIEQLAVDNTGESTTSYAVTMRSVLDYQRLGINEIWLESGEPAPVGLRPIARSFLNDNEVTNLNFSIDGFGGGGLAGSTGDIARFFAQLTDGSVFAERATLAAMLTVPDTNINVAEFGLVLGDGARGLYRQQISGVTCWTHRGFLGTIAVTCPDSNIAVVVTTNTALTDPLPVASALLASAVEQSADG